MNDKARRVWFYLLLFLPFGLILSFLAGNVLNAIERAEALRQMESPEATEAFFKRFELVEDVNSGITLVVAEPYISLERAMQALPLTCG